MASSGRQKLQRWLYSRWVYFLLALIVVNYLAYGTTFVTTIYADDWTQTIERAVTGTIQWFDAGSRRPLHLTPFLIQYRLFGLNVTAFYAILWILQIVLTILVYKIANHFPILQRYSFSLVLALSFLVFPTSYTHMWLTMLPIYCAAGLTLFYAYFLLRFAEEGQTRTLILALACFWLSFYVYEAQIGLACAWSLFLATCYNKITTNERQNGTRRICPAFIHSVDKRRLALLAPIALTGAFAIWRTLGQRAIGVQDPYMLQLTTTPQILFSRLLLGFKISLIWGWTTTIQHLLQEKVNNVYAFLILVGILLALWWLVARIVHIFRIRYSEAERWPFVHRWNGIRPYSLLLMVGLLMIGAGYVPVIAVYLPNLSGGASRFNFFASFGSAVVWASILMIGALLFSKTPQAVKYIFLVSSIPLLILGIATQALVEQDNRVAWQEQQTIWRELFAAAPDFEDGTMVLFVLPGYQDRTGYQNWRRTPLSASWEVSSAVRLLYNNPTLSSDVVFPDIEEPTEPILTPQGIFTRDTGILTPYAKCVAFVYDNRTGTLRQLAELPGDMVEMSSAPVQLGTDRILAQRVHDVPLRRLVEDH